MSITITVLGVIGFFVCLFIMYGTNHGISGITKYDESFKLLDMQFRYNSNKVYETFGKIGIDGQKAYFNYLILDYFFIICFFIVMFAITKKVVQNDILCKVLIMVAIARGLLDMLENTLLILLIKQYPTQNTVLANICSWATTVKFLALYLWIIGVIIAVANLILRKK